MRYRSFFSEKKSLLLLGITVVILVTLCAISIKTGIMGKSFCINKAVICVELDKERNPHKEFKTLKYGIPQVCLWFKYSSANIGNRLEIIWYYDNAPIISEPVKLMTINGIRSFYLLHKDGQPLPIGNYKVKIISPTKELCSLNFEITKK